MLVSPAQSNESNIIDTCMKTAECLPLDLSLLFVRFRDFGSLTTNFDVPSEPMVLRYPIYFTYDRGKKFIKLK